jgi:NAD(P)-dependent dehydrogenase (short-subunit alcohol dehydrogenase family)
MEITGARAVVTGGATGIGRGIALALADEGAAAIVIADVNREKAERTAGEVSARGAEAEVRICDIRDRDAIEALADFVWGRMGGVDLLFNNAGVGRTALAFDLADEDIAWQVEVNLIGTIQGTRIFGRRMMAEPGRGWICNTASQAGICARDPLLAFYTATKHGIVGFTDALRNEVGDQLGLSVLCPAVVATDMWQAGMTRQAAFGGPFAGDPDAKLFMDREGLDPDHVGRLAVEGVRDELFWIWTQPFTIELAEQRFIEQRAASLHQWPAGDAGVERRAAWRPIGQ